MISRRLFLRSAPAIPAAMAATAEAANDPKRVVWVKGGARTLLADGTAGPLAARCFLYIDGQDSGQFATADLRGETAFIERYERGPDRRIRRLLNCYPLTKIEAVERRRCEIVFKTPRCVRGFTFGVNLKS